MSSDVMVCLNLHGIFLPATELIQNNYSEDNKKLIEVGYMSSKVQVDHLPDCRKNVYGCFEVRTLMQ